MPYFQLPCNEKERDPKGAQACPGIACDHGAPAVPSVHQCPGEGGKEDPREGGKQHDEGEPGDGARGLERPHTQGESGELRTNKRDQLAEPNQDKRPNAFYP